MWSASAPTPAPRRWLDLDDRPFKFRNGEAVENADGPLVVMNGAGWRGQYPPAEGEKPGWFHGREGAGVSIVLDVVPSCMFQLHGGPGVGEGPGMITHTAVARSSIA